MSGGPSFQQAFTHAPCGHVDPLSIFCKPDSPLVQPPPSIDGSGQGGASQEGPMLRKRTRAATMANESSPAPPPKAAWQRVDVGPPKGVRNLTNTCYMTVVLQALFACAHIRSFFLSGVMPEAAEEDDAAEGDAGIQVLHALVRAIFRLAQRHLSPHPLCFWPPAACAGPSQDPDGCKKNCFWTVPEILLKLTAAMTADLPPIASTQWHVFVAA